MSWLLEHWWQILGLAALIDLATYAIIGAVMWRRRA